MFKYRITEDGPKPPNTEFTFPKLLNKAELNSAAVLLFFFCKITVFLSSQKPTAFFMNFSVEK